ncbi:hypothetical protein [Methylobacterium sp. WSM2598]|uniref:hypothetical protein n=1 Tax=Methylobacterium sp. WSM2598 TaxID=398261 RepID=UPI0003680451|nr:hypothetical protein [Methylobacterium sp. WSM2598]
MEADTLKNPPFRVLTYRDGQDVIIETVQTPEAAQIRFASAVDLCRTRDDAHTHRVELWHGQELLEMWRGETD